MAPLTGGVIVFTDTAGVSATLDVPSDAISLSPVVTEVFKLIYAPLSTSTVLPTGQSFARLAFSLEAFLNEQLLTGFTFNKPVTVTVNYTDAEIAGLDETELRLMTWDGTTWVEAACGPSERDLAANWLKTPICHLSNFAVAGPSLRQLYLPLVVHGETAPTLMAGPRGVISVASRFHPRDR